MKDVDVEAFVAALVVDGRPMAERARAVRALAEALDEAHPAFDVIADLAWDLEFYSPSSSARDEEPLLLDEAKANERISHALRRLRDTRT